MLPFENLPKSLVPIAESRWQSLVDTWGEALLADYQTILTDADLSRQLTTVLACSPFVAKQLRRTPLLLKELVESKDLLQGYELSEWSMRLTALLETVSTESDLKQALRRFRQREMVRIIWRDFNRLAMMEETVADVSQMADAVIDVAQQWLHRSLVETYGEPLDSAGKAQQLVVLGMGKLGARELNLSSDIDLIFAYPRAGYTAGADKQLANQDFFIRLSKRLIQAIEQFTEDGFVFRVDMRLRPYGQSGALALSFDALEEYYQEQGRDWERYAMLKARICAGDRDEGEHLLTRLRPFVYRRYIDYSVIESLRGMKTLIEREVKRRGLDNDVKLGPGGIREVEFVVQCMQLIHGGRHRQLQQSGLLTMLDALRDGEFLPEQTVVELKSDYQFLRNTEHAIQGYNDKQTQTLPSEDEAQAALAQVMGFADWQAFVAQLDAARSNVRTHFDQVIAVEHEQGETALQASQATIQAWQICIQAHEETELVSTMESVGFGDDSTEVATLLRDLCASNAFKHMDEESHRRLDITMPLLLDAVLLHKKPLRPLQRIVPLIETILRRSVYLAMLNENAHLLEQLVLLCEASPWIATLLVRYPLLLEELQDVRSLYNLPRRQDLRDELRQQLSRLLPDDLESHLETLSYFKLANTLKAAAGEITGRLPLMKVSDYLTHIAEVVLENALQLAWQDLTSKYGAPTKADGSVCDPDFIIVAYGKLGGLELGYGSDLDLVFIHRANDFGETTGEKSVNNQQFFARLGQRLIHMLTARTHLGVLYEIDMRLRPSGESGLLVSSLAAFEKYQQESAWTWEHQALVRARVVAGDAQLAKDFDDVRKGILSLERDQEVTRRDVLEMREKMRDHLLPVEEREGKNSSFSLKQGNGGIVDIEFMIQYAVLVWANTCPELTKYSDNIRIIEKLAMHQLLQSADASALIAAYKAYRQALHQQSLQDLPGTLPAKRFQQHRKAVSQLWQALLETPS